MLIPSQTKIKQLIAIGVNSVLQYILKCTMRNTVTKIPKGYPLNIQHKRQNYKIRPSTRHRLTSITSFVWFFRKKKQNNEKNLQKPKNQFKRIVTIIRRSVLKQ
jgi:hypothetical protein